MLLRCKFCGQTEVRPEIKAEHLRDVLRLQCTNYECKFTYAKERSVVPEGYRVSYKTNGWGYVEPIPTVKKTNKKRSEE